MDTRFPAIDADVGSNALPLEPITLLTISGSAQVGGGGGGTATRPVSYTVKLLFNIDKKASFHLIVKTEKNCENVGY